MTPVKMELSIWITGLLFSQQQEKRGFPREKHWVLCVIQRGEVIKSEQILIKMQDPRAGHPSDPVNEGKCS